MANYIVLLDRDYHFNESPSITREELIYVLSNLKEDEITPAVYSTDAQLSTSIVTSLGIDIEIGNLIDFAADFNGDAGWFVVRILNTDEA